MLHEVDFKALPSALVEKIDLDVGDLKVGDTIRVKDLDITKIENLDVTTDPDTTVVTITEIHASASDDDTDSEENADA